MLVNADHQSAKSFVSAIAKPMKSVKKPGIINNKAANAIAAPDIISYAGNSFLTNWVNPDFRVFKPSYLA